MVRFTRAITLGIVTALAVPLVLFLVPETQGGVTSEQVELAIRDGIRFLKGRQNKGDGSWAEVEMRTGVGTTALVTLALLTAGEKADAPEVARALDYLRKHTPDELRSTYAIALQTMVYALADPERDRVRIVANVNWLEQAQITPNDRVPWPGAWTYSDQKNQAGDNSNTQYALLGLSAAHEAGVPVNPDVWALSRAYFERFQTRDGGWGYTIGRSNPTGSMTCAGVSSLVITGVRRYMGQEFLQGEAIRDCGKGGFNINLARGVAWLANHFSVQQNFGNGQQWRYYYLYALERAGRLAGVRYFGRNDWYRLGAEELVQSQNRLSGFWRGGGSENELVATSFALLFLAKGRSPVIINKLFREPITDWNNDPDDVRELTNETSRDWKTLLTWQIVNPAYASVEDMLQAPIAFMNGHEAPELSPAARKTLRGYLEQGGFLMADACCGDSRFDAGFRRLIKEILPEEEYQLKLLPPEHPVYRARYNLDPNWNPLYGVEHGCRTIVIYSAQDLSCYWNQAERDPRNPAVIRGMHVGRNIVDYATGRERPADKLAVRATVSPQLDAPRRGALRVAKLKYAGDWNIAPRAVANLMETLRRPPLNFDVVINQKDLAARDQGLIYYPLVYLHGRSAMAFDQEDIEALRRHLEPGGGTLFADAACGSFAFDTAFRKFVKELLPGKPLTPIPRNDPLYSTKIAFDLSDCQYTPAAGGGQDFPQLEGIKINDHWAIIYSKLDIGCALERHSGIDCKGYTHTSATRIAANVVIYSTLP